MSLPLPPAFLTRMQTLLGEEYDAFLASYAASPHVGLRVNTLKLSVEEFQTLAPFPLDPIPWNPTGFRVLESETRPFDAAQGRPGLHPYHAAGLYYLQEPSAQAVAEILDPQPGERILDLAAAPGGKTTHIAAKMQNRGVLVANEIHPKRVWDLAKNLERWGARHVIITHETPERLADALPAYFDRVLVDAPCSGEGMFRKTPDAIRDWSPEFVAGCAMRQTNILDTAAQLVRPGGWLCYATCTFAPEENEHVIARFLASHPEFALVSPPQRPGFTPTSPSAPVPLFSPPPSSLTTIRLFPHRAPGEGHFIALLQRQPSPQPSSPTPYPFVQT
ncbi:MAG: RsmB/NOP family class I SAM-dependent RNA methyltransferase, partial [Anaerolineales bacterium]|nr:RsmB/NOP family class I SAM-dependent RNA methyltransferase [Anaerolineales bacterium]